jgi:sterol desaturase/sphingolipid hydroxylase (fatty acid hydroxylase superfamily)
VSIYLNLVGSVALLSLVFYPFELLLPAEKNQPLANRVFNLAYVPLFLAVVVFVLQPLMNAFAGKFFVLIGGGTLPRFIAPPASLAGHLSFAFAYAVWWDVWQYWLHRLQHSVPFLWETHKFHHSETALNATTQARHHVLHHVLTFVFYLPVLCIVGSHTPHYLVVFAMFRLWGFVNHANIRIGLGTVTPLISAPQWHRIHHSILSQHQDKNFATLFPFIDMAFGTYYKPLRNEFPPTGLRGEEPSAPFSEATVGPLIAWFRNTRHRLMKFRFAR